MGKSEEVTGMWTGDTSIDSGNIYLELPDVETQKKDFIITQHLNNSGVVTHSFYTSKTIDYVEGFVEGLKKNPDTKRVEIEYNSD